MLDVPIPFLPGANMDLVELRNFGIAPELDAGEAVGDAVGLEVLELFFTEPLGVRNDGPIESGRPLRLLRLAVALDFQADTALGLHAIRKGDVAENVLLHD